ncbi:MAG: nitroreductase family protein [Flavobacteriales bacterium]|nr:nitroreductase family protein [Flavobacteriales bacterium]
METIKIKTPNTTYPVNTLLLKRWSALSFSEKQIEETNLLCIFEAASWAASSMNEQPWEYHYAYRGTPAFEKMWNCLLEGNKNWSKNASVLILSLARKNLLRNNLPNRHALYDTGAANTNLMLQAAAQDIYGHQMGGFDVDKTKTEFSISDDYEIACFICLGYLDTPEKLEDKFKARETSPRKRKNLQEFVKKWE